MNDSKEVIFRAHKLAKSYYHLGKEVPVLQNLNLVVNQGDLISIVGKSGVGKSTFLHVCGTLDRPTRGELIYGNVNVLDLPEDELARFRNRTIGFVFQFHHLLAEFSSLDNVLMPALVAKENIAGATRRAKDLLDRVGLSHRLTHRPGELSGGEQQRVAIARALMMSPKLIFADEPTGNLDEHTSADINALLFSLNREMGLTLIVVTHSFELARSMERNYLMSDGGLVELEKGWAVRMSLQD